MISIAITLTKEMWELNKITGRNLSFLFPKINTATESTTSRDNSITINSPILVYPNQKYEQTQRTQRIYGFAKKLWIPSGTNRRGYQNI